MDAVKSKAWNWAEAQIEAQKNDPRQDLICMEHRAVTDIKEMLTSSYELYRNTPAFYTKFRKGPYQTITYEEFYNDVNGLGTALLFLGLKGKRIAVIGETNYTWCVAYMAVVCGCGIVVPIDKELPYDNLKNIVSEAEVSAVIADAVRAPLFDRMVDEGGTSLELVIAQNGEDRGDNRSQSKLTEAGKAMIAGGDRSYTDAQIDPEAMSVLLYTSGTTGVAKGIMLSQKNIAADLMATLTFINAHPGDIFFSVLPIHHTFECTANFLIPIYQGAAIAHCEGLKYIEKNLKEIKPSFMMVVPAILEALDKSVWRNIRKQGKEKTVKKAMRISDALLRMHIDIRPHLFREIQSALGGNVRMIISGGAAINPHILDDFRSWGIPAVQGYGLSECSPIVALNPELCPHSESCGMVLPGFDAKIEDARDGIGEICFKGDNIMLGYYRNPDATAEAIKDGWFHTGDLGYIDPDGYIIITGRKKNVIITKNGKNVFPEELEYQLSNYSEIAECMVFEDESDFRDDTVIGAAIYPDRDVIKKQLGGETDNDDAVTELLWGVVNKVNDYNPPYKMIKRIYLRHTEFRKNSSAKILRFEESNKYENGN